MKDKLHAAINSHRQQISVLIKYMEVKANSKDWHAVSDAANDIRELETGVNLCEELIRELESRSAMASKQANVDNVVPGERAIPAVEKREGSPLRSGSEKDSGGETGRSE